MLAFHGFGSNFSRNCFGNIFALQIVLGFWLTLGRKDHGDGFHWVRMAAEIAVGLRVR